MMAQHRATTRALIEAAEEKPRLSRRVVRVLRRHGDEPGIVDRVARFQRFYAEQRDREFVWGQADCSLFVADWAIALGHLDPAAHLRDQYDTALGCRRLLRKHGGIQAVVGECAEGIGMRRVDQPTFGAIAVIGAADDEWQQWSAIWDGFRWLVKWDDDLTIFNAKPLVIWSFV